MTSAKYRCFYPEQAKLADLNPADDHVHHQGAQHSQQTYNSIPLAVE